MMIPPIVAQAAPARDSATPPADGFEQAMAAALGIVPPQAQAPHTIVNETAPAVAVAPGLHALIAAGTPARAGDGTQATSTPAQLGSGFPGGALATATNGTGPATPTTDGASDPMPAAEIGADGQPTTTTTTTAATTTTTTTESGSVGTPKPASGQEPTELQVGRTGVPLGQGLTQAAGMAAAVTAVSPAIVAPNQAAVSQGPDRAGISAQALGLRSLRAATPGTDVAAQTATPNASGAGSGPIADALGSVDRSGDPGSAAAPTSGESTGEGPVVATVIAERPVDRSSAMPEHAVPGPDVAAETGLSIGTERPARPQDPGRQPAQPQAPTLDAMSAGGDQVTAQAPLPGGAVDGGTHVPSGMLQRVEDAVRRLENAPPPRSITLTIDDQGLTRVTVSVLSDGVRLTVPEGSQAPSGLVQDLEQALSSHGFEMSRDGEQQKRHRPDDEEMPFGAPPAQPRRTTADTGVRL
ncbi:MAG: hypothetical protein ACFCVC_11940 [Acidimicrobiia bacterium]